MRTSSNAGASGLWGTQHAPSGGLQQRISHHLASHQPASRNLSSPALQMDVRVPSSVSSSGGYGSGGQRGQRDVALRKLSQQARWREQREAQEQQRRANDELSPSWNGGVGGGFGGGNGVHHRATRAGTPASPHNTLTQPNHAAAPTTTAAGGGVHARQADLALDVPFEGEELVDSTRMLTNGQTSLMNAAHGQPALSSGAAMSATHDDELGGGVNTSSSSSAAAASLRSSAAAQAQATGNSPTSARGSARKSQPHAPLQAAETQQAASTQQAAQEPVGDTESVSAEGFDKTAAGGGATGGAQTVGRTKVDPASLPPLPELRIVRGRAETRAAMELLCSEYRDCVFACDTEVSHIDVSSESPVGHGKVICLSIYTARDDADMNKGVARNNNNNSTSMSSCTPTNENAVLLWVDTMLDGDEEEIQGVFEELQVFFQDASIRKVWHNYGFDRHVLANHGVYAEGFAGDTMHMARLYDSSRTRGYSLADLSKDDTLMRAYSSNTNLDRAKVSMKDLFGKPNMKKDGTAGKLEVVPPVEELQVGEETRKYWIDYSAFDAKATWHLYKALEVKLKGENICMDPAVRGVYTRAHTLWDLYREVWLPFGKLLTDLEAEGMLVDRPHLAAGQRAAELDKQAAIDRFRAWASSLVPDAKYMNVTSGPQIRQLLFAGVENKGKEKKGARLEMARVFKALNEEGYIEPGKKQPKKHIDFTLTGLWGPQFRSPLDPEVLTASGWPAVSTPVLRKLAGKPGVAKRALEEMGVGEERGGHMSDDGVSVSALMEDAETALYDLTSGDEGDMAGNGGSNSNTSNRNSNSASNSISNSISNSNDGLTADSGAPMLNEALQKDLEAEAAIKGYGKLYAVFNGGVEGLRACAAVDALCEVSAIDTLLSNFLCPLQGDAISTPDGRVHCSLNINTETGRLSARRPNLQNQPALEKDRYKVRKAFTANSAAGNTLIVADYGQLELRVLAHMAQCASMMEAFILGGDFHSRTAVGMYDYIQDAIKAGDVLLEWEGEGPPPLPLVKDVYGSERRKAKVLNFSIAYGKTEHGLSKDWGVDIQEARATVDRWYADRKEVQEWQKLRRQDAEIKGYVETILGRRRMLPDAKGGNAKAKAHALRAAINTPIQGSAADIATVAMLQIDRDQALRDLGWKLLLQVHDEVILEGPKATAAEAQARVVDCMQHPFLGHNPLSVELVVDSKVADTWYEAK